MTDNTYTARKLTQWTCSTPLQRFLSHLLVDACTTFWHFVPIKVHNIHFKNPKALKLWTSN